MFDTKYLGIPIDCSVHQKCFNEIDEKIMDNPFLSLPIIYDDIIREDPSIELMVNDILNDDNKKVVQRKITVKPTRRITRSYTMRVLRSRKYRVPYDCY